MSNERLIVGVHIRRRNSSRRTDLPVIRVELPEDGAQSKTSGDGPNTVVNVTEGRPPAGGSDTDDEFDRVQLEKINMSHCKDAH